MAGLNFFQLRRARYTAVQLEVLEAVEDAWKHQAINFTTAVKLRDCVKAGKVDVVLEVLERKTGKPMKLADLIKVKEEKPN